MMRIRMRYLETFLDRHGRRRYYVRMSRRGERHVMPDPGRGPRPSEEFVNRYRDILGFLPEVRKRLDKRPGVIYFVGYDTFVKIGYTRDLEGRIQTIGISCPQKLTVYRTLPGTVAAERKLHRQFQDYRLNGEWFDARGELAEYLGIGVAPEVWIRGK